MKIYRTTFAAILLALLATACGNRSAATLDEFTETVYSPRYASGFSIKGIEGKESVLITVFNPWQNADGVVARLFIARNEELVNAVFAPQEQVGQAQIDLLGAAFVLASAGLAQTHIGTGAGGSHSDLPWDGKTNNGRRR